MEASSERACKTDALAGSSDEACLSAASWSLVSYCHEFVELFLCLSYIHLRTILLLPLVLFFLFLCVNMLSAARIAQYDCYKLDGPGFEFRYGKKISLPRHLPSCGVGWGGVFSWKFDPTRIHLVPTLRMCGAIPSLPCILSWRAYGLRGSGYERARYRTVKLAKCGT